MIENHVNGFEHIQLADRFTVEPGKGLTLHARGNSTVRIDCKHLKFNSGMLVVVRDRRQFPGMLHLNAELFTKLPNQCRASILSRFDFASRKLPLTCTRRPRTPLLDKQIAVPIDQQANHHLHSRLNYGSLH